MKQRSILLLAFLLLPMPALAQSTLKGTWVADITPPGASTFTFVMEVEHEPDSLRMTAATDHGVLVMEEASYVEGRWHFVMPLGHGRVVCNVYRREEGGFAGVCTGPMGESVTTMQRAAEGGE